MWWHHKNIPSINLRKTLPRYWICQCHDLELSQLSELWKINFWAQCDCIHLQAKPSARLREENPMFELNKHCLKILKQCLKGWECSSVGGPWVQSAAWNEERMNERKKKRRKIKRKKKKRKKKRGRRKTGRKIRETSVVYMAPSLQNFLNSRPNRLRQDPLWNTNPKVIFVDHLKTVNICGQFFSFPL